MTKDYQAILLADECRKANNRIGTFQNIKNGLTYNYKNYELYFMLGEYYLDENPIKAYLCFENAAFFCSDPDDKSFILESMNQLEAQGIKPPKVSIVILSYNAKDHMRLCLESLRRTVSPEVCEIIVIDNASTDGVTDYLKEQTDITLICNDENVGFPAGCNQGIAASCPENDIFLLNNDTIVTDNALFYLRMGLYEDGTIGGTGSVSNNISNNQQIEISYNTPGESMKYALDHNVPMEHPYEEKLQLMGFAMLLKRTVLDEVGLLDERFSPGNYEDNDLSLRIIDAGYKLLLCRNSFILHFGSTGFGKDPKKYNELLLTNSNKFKDKWGFDINYYGNIRLDVTSLIDNAPDSHINVLEVGCGMGTTLGHIRNTYPNSTIHGIELMPRIAEFANKYIGDVICGNIESLELPYENNQFDYIIFADVLEHLVDPEAVLLKMREYLKPSGYILTSLPNIMHYSVILDLLRGNFTYQSCGILDRTHLKFFTYNEIVKLFERLGYRIEVIKYNPFEAVLTEEDQQLLDQLTALPGLADPAQFHAYQYLVKAQVQK